MTKQEVIKIKLITCSREDKKAMAEFICGKFGAQCIQSIGHMILLYRTSQKAKPRSS